eukprot:scaffold5.g716.t1
MRKRKGYEPLTIRLAKLQCGLTPSTAAVAHSRRLFENVAPGAALPGLAPPPNTAFCRFTPCGCFLLAVQTVQNELVCYRYRSVERCLPEAPGPAAPGADAPAAMEADAAVAGAAAPATQQQQQQQQQGQGFQLGHQLPQEHQAPHGAAEAVSPPEAPLPVQPVQQQAAAGPPPALSGGPLRFSDLFAEAWRCSPALPSSEEQLAPGFCLAVGPGLVLVASASRETGQVQVVDSEGLLPVCDSVAFHLVRLESGCVEDRFTLLNDYVDLAGHGGAYLQGDLLLILALTSQQLHLMRISAAGHFVPLRTLGQHCQEDDEAVVQRQQETERRVQQQLRLDRQQRQQQAAVQHGVHAVQHGVHAPTSLPQQQQQQPAGQPGGWGLPAPVPEAPPGDAAGGHAAAGSGAPAASQLPEEGSDWEGDEGEEGSMITGLKQRLLAHLFLEARRQSAAVAGPGPGSAAAAVGAHAGFAGACAGAGAGGALCAGGSGGGADSRRPLDRFHYHFEALQDLVMVRAQLLGPERLLVLWAAPDLLSPLGADAHGTPRGPSGGTLGAGAPRPSHHAAQAARRQQGQGSHLMLYDMRSAQVEAVFPAQSPELLEWYLQDPGALLPPPACEWERAAPPPALAAPARAARARDPMAFAREWRARLADELPAPCQERQASPYVDPGLYQFWERLQGAGACRPHHLPHRALKFLARCQPERLLFRFDPEHLAPPVTGAAAAGSEALGWAHMDLLLEALAAAKAQLGGRHVGIDALRAIARDLDAALDPILASGNPQEQQAAYEATLGTAGVRLPLGKDYQTPAQRVADCFGLSKMLRQLILARKDRVGAARAAAFPKGKPPEETRWVIDLSKRSIDCDDPSLKAVLLGREQSIALLDLDARGARAEECVRQGEEAVARLAAAGVPVGTRRARVGKRLKLLVSKQDVEFQQQLGRYQAFCNELAFCHHAEAALVARQAVVDDRVANAEAVAAAAAAAEEAAAANKAALPVASCMPPRAMGAQASSQLQNELVAVDASLLQLGGGAATLQPGDQQAAAAGADGQKRRVLGAAAPAVPEAPGKPAVAGLAVPARASPKQPHDAPAGLAAAAVDAVRYRHRRTLAMDLDHDCMGSAARGSQGGPGAATAQHVAAAAPQQPSNAAEHSPNHVAMAASGGTASAKRAAQAAAEAALAKRHRAEHELEVAQSAAVAAPMEVEQGGAGVPMSPAMLAALRMGSAATPPAPSSAAVQPAAAATGVGSASQQPVAAPGSSSWRLPITPGRALLQTTLTGRVAAQTSGRRRSTASKQPRQSKLQRDVARVIRMLDSGEEVASAEDCALADHVAAARSDNLGKATHTLAAGNLLSLPVFDSRGEYAGCFSVNDLLTSLVEAAKAKDPHFIESGSLTAADLKAIGHSLAAKKVGELEHSGSLWMVGAGLQSSVLDIVTEAFSIKARQRGGAELDPHHVHHRVYIAAPRDAEGHTAAAGATTVVSGKGSGMRVRHVLTHTDVVRLLFERRAELGELLGKTVEQLELDAGAVFCVPASTPALVAFGKLAADQKSSLGLVDAAGALVGNLSVSDLRGLSGDDFDKLLLPATEYLASRAGAAPKMACVSTSSTLEQVLETLVTRRIHRVYVTGEGNVPVSIITLTDILRLATRA